MRYLIVYAHPNPKSFNNAIKEKVEARLKREGAQYDVRDLYGLGFDPVLKGSDFVGFKQGKPPEEISREQEFIKNADTLIFIHPVWWFGQPAGIGRHNLPLFQEQGRALPGYGEREGRRVPVACRRRNSRYIGAG
ncbi:MAG TPA: NAD(P)H-dependent oxidoreductase [Candidatus Omnitrophota bacterium]|nr:NAD(P)H-dependent oxidoreductase [Candidatus Omnitrophota bacterium]